MKKRIFIIFTIIAVELLLFGGRIGAHEKAHEQKSNQGADLGEIVITATKTEKIIRDVPAHSSLVNRDEIQEHNIKTLDEAIYYLEGVYNKRARGFMDTSQRVSLRGFAGAKGTLVLLDNRPLNMGFGGKVLWDAIPIDSVERIEIVRGPFSSLHGGAAMGGVINIITKKPKKQEIFGEYTYGTDNTHIFKVHYGDQWADRFSFFTAYEKRKTDGYRTCPITKSSTTTQPSGNTPTVTGAKASEDEYGNPIYIIGDNGENGWEQDNLNLKFTYSPTLSSELNLYYAYNESEYFYRDWRSYLLDPAGNVVTSGNVEIDPNTEYITSIREYNFLTGPGGGKTNMVSAGYKQQIGRDFYINLQGGITDQFENWAIKPLSSATNNGGVGEISRTPNSTSNAELQIDWTGFNRHILTIGVSGSWQKSEKTVHRLTNWRDEDSRAEKMGLTEGKVNYQSLFLQEEYRPMDQLTLFAGGRWDSWKTRDGRSAKRTDPNQPLTINSFEDRSDHYVSPKLSLLYKPVDHTGIRASWGKAFRGPGVNELYNVWTTGSGASQKEYRYNPDLEPETTSSWEIGFDHYITTHSFYRCTYFYNDIDNIIYQETTQDPTDNHTIYTKQNAGQGVSKGVEFALHYRINQGLDYLFNYTYTDSRITQNRANPDSENKRLAKVPENMFNTGFVYRRDKIRSSIFGRYVGKVYDLDDNADTNEGYYKCYDPFFLVDLNLSYEIAKYSTLILSVDNLFDEEYYQEYLAPGRSIYAKIKVGIY
ncbi:MAG: TonB-dependent receptor [bacterium]